MLHEFGRFYKYCSLNRCISRFLSSTPRSFRILGLQQIAIGGLKKQPLLSLWNDLFGVPVIGTFRSEKENVDEDILKLGVGPFSVEVDIMEPIDAEKSPKVHIPQLNHIGLWVDNIDSAYSSLQAKGVRFTPGGIRIGAGGHKVCFIHPKSDDKIANSRSGEGILIELVQAPESVISAFNNESKTK